MGLALSGVQRRQVAHLSSWRWSPSGVLGRILYDFQAPLGKNQSRVVSGGAPWKADLEMGICTGERFTGKISRGEREEAGPGRGRGWFCNMVTTELYASPVWSTKIRMGFKVISN